MDAKVAESSIEGYIKNGGDPKRYPRYSALDVTETQKRLGMRFSSWKEIVDKLVDQGFE